MRDSLTPATSLVAVAIPWQNVVFTGPLREATPQCAHKPNGGRDSSSKSPHLGRILLWRFWLPLCRPAQPDLSHAQDSAPQKAYTLPDLLPHHPAPLQGKLWGVWEGHWGGGLVSLQGLNVYQNQTLLPHSSTQGTVPRICPLGPPWGAVGLLLPHLRLRVAPWRTSSGCPVGRSWGTWAYLEELHGFGEGHCALAVPQGGHLVALKSPRMSRHGSCGLSWV